VGDVKEDVLCKVYEGGQVSTFDIKEIASPAFGRLAMTEKGPSQ